MTQRWISLNMTMMTKQIALTGVILLLSVLFLEYSDADVVIQNYLYDFELNQWVLDRDNWISKFIFYDGIKRVLIVTILLIIVALLFFRKNQLINTYKSELLIVVLSAILVPSVVGGLKAATNIPCPNNLKYYGGEYPYVTLLKHYPSNFNQKEKVKCYPAGHASGGFALLSLMFLFNRRRNKVIAALSVLSIGWSMGIYKMLIGDHFLGHTVVTMILAWLLILIIAKSVYGLSASFYRSPQKATLGLLLGQQSLIVNHHKLKREDIK